MEIKAQARYLRIAPRKVRLVVDLVRGMSVLSAREQLRFMKKAAAKPVLKVLDSAIANAKHNFQLPVDQLMIKTITADQGPVIKRWTPKAHGRATPIRKRMTHVSIILDEPSSVPAKKTPRSPSRA